MKITLKEILNASESIKSLQEVKLPVKVSYRLMRLVNKLSPELETYNHKRNELVKEYGEKNDKGDMEVKDPEKLQLFIEKVSELAEEEIDVDWEKIKISDLGEVLVASKDLVSFIFAE